MAELLIELFSEEIPAGLQVKTASAFADLIAKGLKDANLETSSIASYSTPRRLTVVVDGIPLAQPDIKDERKGPKVGAPEQAMAGFLRGAGLDSLEQCEQRDTSKGAVWYAVIERKGLPTADVLPAIVQSAVKAVAWAKPMRFASVGFRWVRPLHSVIALFDGKTLDGGIDMQGGEIAFGNTTRGHRFLSEGPLSVTNFADYQSKLHDANVVLNPEERKAAITIQLDTVAAANGLLVQEDAGLLNEVAGLVEWPVVLIGRIDDNFMEVPREALTSSMREHQKYFTLNNEDGTMASCFAVVANMTASDGGAAIAAGNERVLRARLADAKFFWDQDLKGKLDDFTPKLEKVVFHKQIGTVAERVSRMAKLSEELCKYVDGVSPKLVRRAAELAKADLVSAMVTEFADLQGVMGKYYAIKQGEDIAVANAIEDHYSPKGPTDACPTAPVSVVVALAEKLDILAGFWHIDEKPTGSKDPFALRRAALGVIRLILENNLRLPLEDILKYAIYQQPAFDNPNMKPTNSLDAKVDDLLDFFADRLKVHLKSEGVKHDHLAAIFAVGGEDDLMRLLARVDALSGFLATDDGTNVLAAYKRGANILRAEEKKDKCQFTGDVNVDEFSTSEEKALYDVLKMSEAISSKKAEKEDYVGAMKALAALRGPMDAFFEGVMVNEEGARINRLNLLSNVRTVMNNLADFSQIEG